jgi:hypothetical protein
MYLETQSASRSGWKYLYLGRNLLAVAEKKLAEFREKERKAREAMSKMIADPLIPPSDRSITQCKADIETYAQQVEECRVYAHEFGRCPDREYNLGMGDVVFFGLLEK